MALAAILAALAEVVRGVRLALLYSSIYGKRDLVRGVEARFAGNIVTLLTPSVAGGEVVRGLVVHGRLEAKAAASIGVAAVDGGLDLIADYTLALAALSVGAAPSAPLPEVLGAAPFAAWLLGLTVIAGGGLHGITERLLRLVEGRRLVSRMASWIRELDRLQLSLSTLASALTLTLLAWILTVSSYSVFTGCHFALSTGCVSELFLMGVIPTPGGIGPGEALLASRCTGIAAWRLVLITSSTLPGLPIFIAQALREARRDAGG